MDFGPVDYEEFRRKIMEALSKRPQAIVPEIKSPPPVKGDDAGKEASALAAGELEAASARREHGRTERFRDNVAVAILIVFWIGFAVVLVAAGLWTFNFFEPPGHEILTSDQSGKIFSFLTGSGLTGFLGNYAKKRLS